MRTSHYSLELSLIVESLAFQTRDERVLIVILQGNLEKNDWECEWGLTWDWSMAIIAPRTCWSLPCFFLAHCFRFCFCHQFWNEENPEQVWQRSDRVRREKTIVCTNFTQLHPHWKWIEWKSISIEFNGYFLLQLYVGRLPGHCLLTHVCAAPQRGLQSRTSWFSTSNWVFSQYFRW